MKFDFSFHNQAKRYSNSSNITPDDKINGMFLPSLAFVLYRPQAKTKKEMFYRNEDALNILAHTISMPSKNKKSSLSSLCSKWKKLLEGKNEKSSENNFKKGRDVNRGVDFIDILQSGRRQYGVRGSIFSQQIPVQKKQEKRYLFILERICATHANMPMIMRAWNLNRLEREIVELLLQGHCNKEIAKTLGLSLNTIKMYLKLLMGKLGVGTRSGIISILLSGRLRRTY